MDIQKQIDDTNGRIDDMNDKLDKFKKVTVSGYDGGHKLFTCDIDISNLRHNYYTIIHYYMTNLELMIMRKDMFK